MRGSRPTSTENGTLDAVLITGFPAGMLACNCYVLAKRTGADAIIVDPGQRAMGPLRQILDDNHLTPAAEMLAHGHGGHLSSAAKAAGMVRCPPRNDTLHTMIMSSPALKTA